MRGKPHPGDDDRAPEAPAKALPAGRMSTVLILLTLGSYAASVIAMAGFPVLMAQRPLGGPFSLAMILGGLQMLLILLATGVYIRAANRREAARELS